MKRKHFLIAIVALVVASSCVDALFAQRGRGPGRGFGGRNDPTFAKDHEDFFFLLANGDKIKREVKELENGVETLTESDDPKVAAKIQQHVAAMYSRVEDVRPIHMRDPLFREIFRNADKIAMKHEKTDKGVRVVETSDDPYVAKLIQEHAKVVSLFVKNGHAEVRKNHAPPAP
jgi:uncharacterized protein